MKMPTTILAKAILGPSFVIIGLADDEGSHRDDGRNSYDDQEGKSMPLDIKLLSWSPFR
jgi:hypothetical protein